MYNFNCNLNLDFHVYNKQISLFWEYEHNHIAKALTSKYPEVGLPSPRGPTILDPNSKGRSSFQRFKISNQYDLFRS